MEEERKCDFYLAEIGEGNQTATRMYNSNACIRKSCANKNPRCNGDMTDRTYRVNNKTVIPFDCWLRILKED